MAVFGVLHFSKTASDYFAQDVKDLQFIANENKINVDFGKEVNAFSSCY